jgi:predicted enzyme related to lactoylglutathione lyase
VLIGVRGRVVVNSRDLYPETMRLACAMVYVKDFPRMKSFYQQMLGAQPVNTEWTDSWALFNAGGTRFSLHAIPAEMARSIEISSPPKAREASPVKLIFAVDDVPAERNRLEAMGIAILQRPWQNGVEECEGVDPEGNIFQISSSINSQSAVPVGQS